MTFRAGREAARGPEITENIAGNIQDTVGGYRVTIVRLCPIGGFRNARVDMAHIGPEPAGMRAVR